MSEVMARLPPQAPSGPISGWSISCSQFLPPRGVGVEGSPRCYLHPAVRLLRPGSSGRSEIRVLFAFDPQRQAILLVAGDKAGKWTKWYRQNIPLADDRFDEHIDQLKRRS